MAVTETKGVTWGSIPPVSAGTNTFNIDISKINPFGVTEGKITKPSVPQNGAGVTTENTAKCTKPATVSELPDANKQSTFGILANYFKNIGSKVTEYDNAVNIVNRYMPTKGDTELAILSNPRIAAIINSNSAYRAYLEENNS